MMDQLINNLNNITSLNEQLLDLGQRKREILLVGEMDTLAKLVKEEEGLVRQLVKEEDQRQVIVDHLAKSLGIYVKEQVPFSTLIERVPNSGYRAQLEQVYEKLSSVILELQELNRLNQQLIEQSLEFVNHTIDLFREIPDEQIYRKPTGKEGDSSTQPARSFFDAKA